MKPITKENSKFIQECKVFAKSVESDLREEYSPYFDKSYMEYTEFEQDDDTEELSGYSGFLIDIPEELRSEYARSIMNSIEVLKPNIEELKLYPYLKIIPQSSTIVSYLFAFQKNPNDFNTMNELTPEEQMMLDSKTPRELHKEENEKGIRRHY